MGEVCEVLCDKARGVCVCVCPSFGVVGPVGQMHLHDPLTHDEPVWGKLTSSPTSASDVYARNHEIAGTHTADTTSYLAAESLPNTTLADCTWDDAFLFSPRNSPLSPVRLRCEALPGTGAHGER